ncbi:glutathione S-transferase family protein [Falsiroseomonas sp.]|uniref:glutathione S-transferase family protein n=1 Tax=Falsiroseomonas sp. TaxID=2870721 RepID=UPI0034A188C9
MTRERCLYAWATPNSQRVSIMLEELGLPYEVRPVNIRAREQFAPEVVALNPYGKIPILVEDGRPPLFESGAILLHLAETHGRFLPPAGDPARAQTLAWLMVALTSVGPFTGQAHHWTGLAPEKPEAARLHTVGLVERVYQLLDKRLGAARFLAGDEYSIADIAAFPWVAKKHWAEMALDDRPHLARWFAHIAKRPAVMRGMNVPAGVRLD